MSTQLIGNTNYFIFFKPGKLLSLTGNRLWLLWREEKNVQIKDVYAEQEEGLPVRARALRDSHTGGLSSSGAKGGGGANTGTVLELF